MPKVKDDHWCFACGTENPHGLHLTGFREEAGDLVLDLTLERCHQGWQGIAHGGLVATVLDETMTTLLYARGQDAVTAELTVRYHRPVPTGAPLQARARQVAQRGRVVQIESELRDAQGERLASAQGKFMLVER
ncbi:MAG TPA: PaaI family thioesterase [Armatimonadota bacterium]|jgi:uncharacterized protein (TIGR00369 family)